MTIVNGTVFDSARSKASRITDERLKARTLTFIDKLESEIRSAEI